MAIIARKPESNFSPAPEGLHQAVCVDVNDLGMVENPFGDPKHQVELRWQLDLDDPLSGGENRPPRRFMVSKRYTLSLHEKATLRHHLESWRGRRFTPDELQGFDLEILVGINCQLQVVHNVKDNGDVWAAVQAIVPLGKGMVKVEPRDYTRVKDRERKADGWGGEQGGASDEPF